MSSGATGELVALSLGTSFCRQAPVHALAFEVRATVTALCRYGRPQAFNRFGFVGSLKPRRLEWFHQSDLLTPLPQLLD